MAETLSAMARRHVAEAETRIARLEALIAGLERDKHAKAAEMGREILANFLESLSLAKAHVASIEAEQSSSPNFKLTD